MLQLLHIENIAVIEQADIELEDGLTVLSGETGAGKSIVIDSIGAVLGRRVSRDLVRTGAQKGFVSAVFTGLSPALHGLLDELALTGEEPDTLHIQRQLTADGKSTCRVNMKPVAAAVLRQLAPYLIDIHGQNDGQKLLDEQYHIDYLDGYAGNGALLDQYRPRYQALLALRREITALETGEQERLQRIDMLTFHKEEIEQAALRPDEEEMLAQRKAYFDHAGKIAGALEQARRALNGDDDAGGACALLDQAAGALAGLREVSGAFDGLAEQAEEVRLLAADLRDSVSGRSDTLDFSPTEREWVEQRLDLIYRLKQKYGGTVAEVLAYRDRIAVELETLQDSDNRREGLRAQYKEELAEAKALAARLGEARRAAAKRLEAEIVRELAALDMEKVRLRIAVHTGAKLSAHGFDTVTFEISVNPGEPEKPLSKVASGGELSRIMLALKNVLTAGEDVGMLIFDEIDTGVSGHAAQQIAYKLSDIGRQKQTLCVTHLPQIAAMGDHHLLISKSVRGERSYTDVQPMDEPSRAREIARMLSGETITELSLQNARELLQKAAEYQRG
ncbi:DNA repair protein RecN [Agathobaculum sp. NSJ-28]|uniref:DNA repair protein RecN n=2 Tax=Agathobaculum TaxID=2048137 RepID=A0A923LWD9_9FIRM|nr:MULTISPECIES: DNA repair protein RecN [Agathobaculum]MBC5725913.1 DNA repair protein RecN [Agathobaculum faecis]MCU6789152.1 DNA repair protein RecN [Agathobaculum ammoniilyticum]SCJ07003.1 Recombination protein N [uncultured Butyricicoccus sp.]